MIELLASLQGTKAVLDRFGIRARKRYGQNFLIDRGVVDGILDAAEVTRTDNVLEIGPGIGTMTQLLSQRAGHVVSVEVDQNLQKVLSETLKDCGNVTVLYQDILKTDLRALTEEYNGGQAMKCIANLPYYITTPILLQLLEDASCFCSITVMVQQEVADRMLATKEDKAYGALSLAVQYRARPRQVLAVAPSSFYPRPEVHSAVLVLDILGEPSVTADEGFLFALIRAAFNQRRKTLANALSHGFCHEGRSLSREEVQAALRQMKLPEDIRGEKLSLEQYAELAGLLSKHDF